MMAQIQLKEIIEQQKQYISFECKDAMADMILTTLQTLYQKLSVINIKDDLYMQMKVKEYIQFFARLHQNTSLLEEAISMMHLHDLAHVPIRKLSASQCYRVMIAREHVADKEVVLMQEPLRHLEEEDVHIVMEWIGSRSKFAKRMYITSNSLKDVCMMPGEHYYINTQKEIEKIENLSNQEEIEQPCKISARSNDKILLFNPNEIDYVESVESKSYLNVRNASFQCSMTMDELEAKLKRFGFYRSHRSYLVNMQKVVEIVKWTRNSYSLKLKDIEAVRIPLSKGRVDEMKDIYDF